MEVKEKNREDKGTEERRYKKVERRGHTSRRKKRKKYETISGPFASKSFRFDTEANGPRLDTLKETLLSVY